MRIVSKKSLPDAIRPPAKTRKQATVAARSGQRARYFTPLKGQRIRCDLCPRECRLNDGQRGLCFVRRNDGGQMVLATYGRSTGFCVDPIEKKPLNHFFPGSSVLSLGTAGCNLSCRFCQNWTTTKSREMDLSSDPVTPEAIASAAEHHGCRSVAYTYNDPTVFVEYAMDIADACRANGIKNVAVTAGYIQAEPRRDLYSKMDALNIDLKAFSEDFYRMQCTASLENVKETLLYVARETKAWLEITTLLIPGYNDGDAEVSALSEWVVENLGAEVPLHFSAFHPAYKMRDVPRTPLLTLQRARAIALSRGLFHVYTGNVHDIEGDCTSCSQCGLTLVSRDWYQLLDYRLREDGSCPNCGTMLAGRFGRGPESFGRRRISVHP